MADVSGGRRTDSATRVIAASRRTIYRAFLDPEAWVKWLPPEGMTGHITNSNRARVEPTGWR
jgi:uncharacterized protein YndB with AHSA1/START domain